MKLSQGNILAFYQDSQYLNSKGFLVVGDFQCGRPVQNIYLGGQYSNEEIISHRQ